MSDLDFYAHVATHRDVLGIGIGSGPGAWEATVGPDYLDDPGKKLLRRDYGLVELSFSDADGLMSCFGISVQVHRLVHGHCVPPSLVREYGEFTPRARFEELRSMILSLGCKIEPDDLPGTSTAIACSSPALASSSSTTPTPSGMAITMSTIQRSTKQATYGR
ncbi:hypothetical protein [Streptomyces sp. NPDC001275]